MSKIIPIICYKHDGSVHRVWDKTFIVYEDERILVLGNDDATVLESDGRNWKAHDPALMIFFKEKWYNIIANIRENGVNYYINIASPYYMNDNALCYIDYDLDVSLKPGLPIRILDEHEYARHALDMKYSKELDYLIKTALYEVIKELEAKNDPFNDESINRYYEMFLKMNKESE